MNSVMIRAGGRQAKARSINDERYLRVVQLCSYYHANTLYTELFEALGARRCKQLLVSPHDTRQTGIPASPDIAVHDRDQKAWSLFYKLFYSRKVANLTHFASPAVAHFKPALLHAHSLYADGLATARIARQQGVPYVITIRAGDLNHFPRTYPHLAGTARRALADAAAVVFVNRHYLSMLAETLQIDLSCKHTAEIPNGVHGRWLELAAKGLPALTPRTSDQPIRIVCTGKLCKRKNQRGLLAALSTLQACDTATPKYTIDFIGQATDEEGRAVEEACRQLTWANCLGPRSQDELVGLYARYDLFALVSHTENFGVCYPEAILSGLPVLYSRGEGFDGWQPDGVYGLAVNSRDTHAIAEAVGALAAGLGAPSNRQSLARDQFSWQGISEQYAELYRHAVAAGGR